MTYPVHAVGLTMMPDGRIVGQQPHARMSAEDCVEHGGHCWQRTGETLASNPPQTPQRCKHCPATRIGTPREAMDWRYPDGQP